MKTRISSATRLNHRSLLLGVISIFWGLPVWAQPEPVESAIALFSSQIDLKILTAEIPSESWTFEVDDTVSLLHLQVVSNVDQLPISILTAGGATVDESTIGGLGGKFFSFELPDDNPGHTPSIIALSGFQYHYLFPVQSAGTYQVDFGPVTGITDAVIIQSMLTTDSQVVANLLTTQSVVPVGSTVVISAILFDGADPVTGATVTAFVKPPDSDEITVSLLDNGTDGDDAVGDGVYSTVMVVDEVGEYGAVAEIAGTRSTGAAFALQVGTSFQVVQPCATLTGALTDCGVDDDENGLYDRIVIEAGVDVSEQSEIGLLVTLETLSGQTLLAQGQAELPAGPGIVAASIDTRLFTEDGPYTITTVELFCYGEDGAMPSSLIVEGTQQTQPYQLDQFEWPLLELTGVITDSGIDSEPDGDFDTLRMNIGILAVREGNYHCYAQLIDVCGNALDVVVGEQFLAARPGSNDLVLDFSGSAIGGNGVDGPYILSALSVWGEGAELYRSSVVETQSYVATEFDSFAPPLDCNGNGVHDLCDVRFETSGDCNFNDVPDECDPPDGDWDGDVDLADFAAFQRCYLAGEGPCLCWFERGCDPTQIEPCDYEVFEAQLTGPDPGDRGAPAPSGSRGSRTGPPAPPWRHEEAAVGLEVRPIGSKAPVTVLRPNTTYEVYYQADYVGVHGYVLFAVGTSPEVSFTRVQPADDGPWAKTGMFSSYNLLKDLGMVIPAFGFPEGHYRYDVVSDRGPGQPQGQLCTFTTGSLGELHLHLYAWWIDDPAMFLASMEARAGFVVTEE